MTLKSGWCIAPPGAHPKHEHCRSVICTCDCHDEPILPTETAVPPHRAVIVDHLEDVTAPTARELAGGIEYTCQLLEDPEPAWVPVDGDEIDVWVPAGPLEPGTQVQVTKVPHRIHTQPDGTFTLHPITETE